MSKASEEDLKELTDFFQRHGRFAGWPIAGGPLHTYPNGDCEQQCKHDMCVELARRGIVVEITHEPSHSCWVTPEELPKWRPDGLEQESVKR